MFGSNSRVTRWVSRGAVVATLAGVSTVAFAGAASAHHANIQAGVSCSGIVSYTASSWDPGKVDGANPNIGIYYRLGAVMNWSSPGSPVASGAFTVTKTSFSGTFTIPSYSPSTSIDVGTRADGTWGDGDTGHETNHTGLFSVTSNCTPPKTTVTPTAPSWTDSSCTAGSASTPTYTIPAITGVGYYDSSDTKLSAGSHDATIGSTITVTAKPDSGYTFGSESSKTYSHTFAGPDCTVHVTVTVPSASDQSCASGKSGQTSAGFITIPSDAGVDYSIDGSKVSAGDIDEAPGTYSVTAAAQSGYTLSGTKTWSLTIGSAGDCTTHVSPAAPSASAASCDGTPGGVTSGFLTIPSTTGVDYQVDGSEVPSGTINEAPGTYTVTAVAESGYTLDGTTTFPLTVAGAGDCTIHVTAVAPAATDQQCSGPGTHTDGSITLTAVKGIDYSIDGTPQAAGDVTVGPGTHTVTAVAEAGYTLDGDAEFTEAVGAAGDCLVTVVPVSPTVTQSVCTIGVGPSEASYTVPSVTGLEYTNDGTTVPAGTYPAAAGTTLTLVAVALPGYQLDAGDNAEFTLEFTTPAGCTALPAATVTDNCANTVVDLSNSGAVAVTFTLTPTSGSPLSVIVDAQSSATHTFPAAAGAVTVAAPGLTTVSHVSGHKCSTPGTTVLGKHVTRHPHPKTSGSAVEASQLPFTGLPTGMMVLLGLAAIAAGALLTVVGARRRSSRQPNA